MGSRQSRQSAAERDQEAMLTLEQHQRQQIRERVERENRLYARDLAYKRALGLRWNETLPKQLGTAGAQHTPRRHEAARPMTAPVFVDFDGETVQTGPPRDKPHDRPLLVPVGGGERTPFTRMSTLAKYLCDDFGLGTWQRRLLAIGMAEREDLCAMVAALPALNDAQCDKKALTKEQRTQDAITKSKLDEYIDLALEQAGRNWKANVGTAIHGLIEGGVSDYAPVARKADVQSCFDALEQRGMRILASEQFVANDELEAAGSFDHIIDVPLPGWGPVIADVKTGQITGKGLEFAVQLSGYANSVVYDWRDDTRAPLESLTDGLRINRKVGLLIHVPLGGGRTQFHRINLMTGYHAARLATQVRKARSLAGSLMSNEEFK